jgi:hypothetical protein
MSLGYEVALSVPFSIFKAMDKKDADISQVSDFIYKVAEAFEHLIN